MNIKVTPFHFEELIKKGYSLDHIFLLRLINEQADISALLKESAKVAALHQSLIRKGLITESEDKITTMGIELLVFMDSKAPGRIVRRKVDDSAFARWWEAYPGTNNFEINGMTFTGARSLRVNESECRTKFDKILLEGKYTADQLINAMKYHVSMMKKESYKKKENKLSYMQNSLTYLNQRSYEPFIELMKPGQVLIDAPEQEGGYDGINL